MITNINTVQKASYNVEKPEQNIQVYSDLFYKEALANLGQRFSVKGDGVSVSDFFLCEIFDRSAPTDAEMDTTYAYAYIKATVSKIDNDDNINDYNISLVANDIVDEFDEYGNPISYLSGVALGSLVRNDLYIASEPIYTYGKKSSSIYSGENICYYGKGGFIYHSNDDIYVTSFISYNGNGADGNETAALEISVEKYDNYRKQILEGLKVYNRNRNYKVLTHIKFETAPNDHYIINHYNVNDPVSFVELYNKYFTNDSFTKYLDDNYNISDLVNNLIDNGVLSSVKTNIGCEYYPDPDSRIEYDDDLNDHDGYILADDDDDAIIGGVSLYELFNKGSINPTNQEVAKENARLIENFINSLNRDCHIFFPYMIKIYNEEEFFFNNTGLKISIVRALLIQLFEDCLADSVGDNKSNYEFVAYFPYNYKFVYSCNSNNLGQIYNSVQDITVECTTKPQNELYKILWYKEHREQLIITTAYDVTDSTEQIFSIYRFSVPYDENDNLKGDIIVRRFYILPYINDDGYWTINNIDTNIYARGKDGGQPSIIITYTDATEDEHNHNIILSTLNQTELATAIRWEPAYYQVRPLNVSGNVGNSLHHMFVTYMPTNISYLNENMITFLENAIIMNINSVHSECVPGSNYAYVSNTSPLADSSQLGPNATVTTFWALTKDPETGFYGFSYVKQPKTPWAIDFNYLGDIEALTKFYLSFAINPDEHFHRWLVFTAAKGSLKHQPDSAFNYEANPVLINRPSSGLMDIFLDIFDADNPDSASDMMYRNNLNFMPAFMTKKSIDQEQGRITGVHESNDDGWRYFFLNTYGRLPVQEEDGEYTYAWAQAMKYPQGVCIDPDYPEIEDVNTGLANDNNHTLEPTNPSSYLKSANEWYPNTLYNNTYSHLTTMLPVFDLKEMFVRNFNLFNRMNILSTDAEGYMYYSYYGTSFDNPNKHIMHLGTARNNINLGLLTLTDADSRQHFNKQDELDVDFDEILFNGNVTFRKHSWDLYEDEDFPYLKMWTTTSQLSYIGGELNNYDSWDDVDTSDKMFNILSNVSTYNENIGNNISVDGLNRYISYVNLDWWLDKKVDLTYYKDNKATTNIYGDPDKIVNYKGSPYLKLTTYVSDESEHVKIGDYEYSYTYTYETWDEETSTYVLHDEEKTISLNDLYWYKCNPLTISYTLDKNIDDNGTYNIYVNIRENVTNKSTAYMLYHGGDLSDYDVEQLSTNTATNIRSLFSNNPLGITPVNLVKNIFNKKLIKK